MGLVWAAVRITVSYNVIVYICFNKEAVIGITKQFEIIDCDKVCPEMKGWTLGISDPTSDQWNAE